MNKLLLNSLLTTDSRLNTTSFALNWVKEQNKKVAVRVDTIAFDDLEGWHFDRSSLRHDSGKFFSIDGLNIHTNYGAVHDWQQPIINQPEIGYLGIIVQEINGVLHFLMQAKIEPGNINHVQLSPTLQATKSNYTKVHKGKEPAFLSYFKNAKSGQILLDQLQSEQGARFLKKRNRNIIIKVDEKLDIPDNFIWLTLGQLKALMRYDNIINMDTRTVISGISFGNFSLADVSVLNKQVNNLSTEFLNSLCDDAEMFHSLNEIINFITELKCRYELNVKQIPISSISDWEVGAKTIHHKNHKYFEVIAARIEIGNREVVHWSQPMVRPVQEGICAFVCKEINGVIHFAVQAKLECGNFDIIELAPTVQCLTGNYNNPNSRARIHFLDYVLHAKKEKILFDTLQSEEGGRFYKEQNRNLIVLAGAEIDNVLPSNFIWITLGQLQVFMRFNNYINIQARSLLSALTFLKNDKRNDG